WWCIKSTTRAAFDQSAHPFGHLHPARSSLRRRQSLRKISVNLGFLAVTPKPPPDPRSPNQLPHRQQRATLQARTPIRCGNRHQVSLGSRYGVIFPAPKVGVAASPVTGLYPTKYSTATTV